MVKKHLQAIRHVVQAMFFALTNGYAVGFVQGKIYQGRNKSLCVPGLNCYSCPGALNACPIGALQAVLNSRQFTVSCYVFGFLMAVGATLGRFVCGWLCPFGLVQDLLHKIPLGKKIKNLPGHRYLTKLKYVVLVVFVLLLPALVKDMTGLGQPWFCEYICPSGTLLAGIPLAILNPGLRAAIGFKFLWKFIVLMVVLVMAVKVYRPFCKYLCPLGAAYGLCNPIALYRYRVDEDKCVTCGACQKACEMDIKVWESPNNMECIRCGKCKTACPTGAITSSTEALRQTVAGHCVKTLHSDETPKRFSRIPTRVLSVLIIFLNIWAAMLVVISTRWDIATPSNFVGKTILGSMLFFLPNMFCIGAVLGSFVAAVLMIMDKGDGVRLLSAYWLQKHVMLLMVVGFVLIIAYLKLTALVVIAIAVVIELIILLMMKALTWKKTKSVEVDTVS